MTVRSYEHSRLANFYQAGITTYGDYPVRVCLWMRFPSPDAVRLVKIDAQGHDQQVNGARLGRAPGCRIAQPRRCAPAASAYLVILMSVYQAQFPRTGIIRSSVRSTR